MGLWENNLATSLTYQDLGDCSLGSLPAVSGLDVVKSEKKENCDLSSLNTNNNSKNVLNIMKRACGAIILVIVGLIAKFM